VRPLRSKRLLAGVLACAAVLAAGAPATGASGGDGPEAAAEALRAARRARLAQELEDEAREDGRKGAPRAAGTARPALFPRMIVGFYRACIGPAIGSRCALEPSCSRYFLEASKRHGWLGVPMIADRFVREPVASASDRWVQNAAGEPRHPDPVDDHDFWMETR
jgi:putative component of membrane protein insertase Oxa1/YidC/SpoIIIJ protein YidD